MSTKLNHQHSFNTKVKLIDRNRSQKKEVYLVFLDLEKYMAQYREGDVAQLEKVQNTVGGLGGPRNTAIDAVGNMGWTSFKERIVKGNSGF